MEAHNSVWEKEPCEHVEVKPDEGTGKGQWRKDHSHGRTGVLSAYPVPGAGDTENKRGSCLGEIEGKICST